MAAFKIEIDLKSSLNNYSGNFDEDDKTFTTVPISHAQKKVKVLRENHKPHYNKTLPKAIMENS